MMARPLPPLIPPFRLCLIEEGVYRGGHPSLKNMRFLCRLKLRTILSLVPEPTGPSRDLREYCDAEHVRLIWHEVAKYDDGFSLTPQLVAAILGELIDPRNHPLFLHCRDGGHNTGLVVMCMRRLQNWSLPTIYEEFMRYTKNNDVTFEEKQFVESFRAPVVIPLQIPTWLWEGVRHSKHPSIQLELDTDPHASNSSLKSPTTSEARERDLFAQMTSPHGERNERSPLQGRRYTHKQIEMHYSPRVAALDLTGVHFAACCRPDIDGQTSANRNHIVGG